MEIRDVDMYRLEREARRAALNRAMGARQRERERTRRRIGGAVVALGLRIAGEPVPRRRYA
jgi:hypothetical protein